LATKLKLRDYQKEAIKKCVQVKNVLWLLKAGSGKTIISMFTARHLLKNNIVDKVVFACTKTAATVFHSEFIEKTGMNISQYDSESDFLTFLNGDKKVGIIKHSLFDKLGKSIHMINELNKIKKRGVRIFLVIDEAHKLSNDEGVHHQAYLRVAPLFDKVALATATPYSSCLSQLYGLVHLIYQKLWKNKREFFDRYIEEEQVMNWATGRTRPEIIRYKDIGKLRKQLEPFSFFYYPPTKINYIEHKARFDSYAEYDELCKGLLEEKDLKK
jgi:superfamily II DNA or RNA helicase